MKQEHDSGLQFKQLAEKYNITWWIISRRLKTLEANINE
jgi:DNA-binding HxlR family transcriptional regulator